KAKKAAAAEEAKKAAAAEEAKKAATAKETTETAPATEQQTKAPETADPSKVKVASKTPDPTAEGQSFESFKTNKAADAVQADKPSQAKPDVAAATNAAAFKSDPMCDGAVPDALPNPAPGKGPLTVIASLLPGADFLGVEEARRRIRYAILAGLAAEGFVPD